MLRSIPPQNRRRSLNALSSMRAATRSGFVFVGSQAVQTARKQSWVIPPDPKAKQQREYMWKGLHQMAEYIEKQIAAAEMPEEVAFWQAALTRLKRE